MKTITTTAAPTLFIHQQLLALGNAAAILGMATGYVIEPKQRAKVRKAAGLAERANKLLNEVLKP